jgi:3-methyladenine DNA glycosylase/8-oxoguanine DNA glycosylase
VLPGRGPTHASAAAAIDRMRFALGTDHDLRAFHRRFRRDPLIGQAIRRWPWLHPRRRPEPFEALAWAVCEQLIDSGRAAAIERSIVRRLRARSASGSSIALIRAAREVASGRANLSEHEPSWRRLLAIRDIGTWTIEMLAFEGQGRDDKLPALDLAYVSLVGRLAHGGRRATEDEVRAFFAPYGEYTALAGIYALGDRYL